MTQKNKKAYKCPRKLLSSESSVQTALINGMGSFSVHVLLILVNE